MPLTRSASLGGAFLSMSTFDMGREFVQTVDVSRETLQGAGHLVNDVTSDTARGVLNLLDRRSY